MIRVAQNYLSVTGYKLIVTLIFAFFLHFFYVPQVIAATEQSDNFKHHKKITLEIITALNAYINFINAEIEQSIEFPLYLNRYHQEVERFIQSDIKSWPGPYYFSEHKSYILPSIQYDIALANSKKLPKKYRRQINDELQVLYNRVVEKEQLIKELHKYAFEKKYLQDDFERYYEIYNRLKNILSQIELLQNGVYETVTFVYNSYEKRASGSTFATLTTQFNTIIQQNKELLSLIRENLNCKDSITKHLNLLQIKQYHLGYVCQQTSMAYNYRQIIDYISTSNARSYEIAQKMQEAYIYPHNESDIVLLMTKHYNKSVAKYNEWCDLIQIPDNCNADKSNTSLVLKKKRETLIYLLNAGEETPVIEVQDQPFYNVAPNHLILLLDVSGSMNSPDRWPILKSAFKEILNLMRSQDHVSIITFSGNAEIQLRKLSCAYQDSIYTILSSLKTKGGTDIDKGIRLAYQLAEKHFVKSGNNKIILATDGAFSISKRSMKIIKRRADDQIHLSVFSFNKRQYSPNLLTEIALTGNGKYYQITRGNIAKALIDELTQQ